MSFQACYPGYPMPMLPQYQWPHGHHYGVGWATYSSPEPPLTEERFRQIIREELRAAGVLKDEKTGL